MPDPVERESVFTNMVAAFAEGKSSLVPLAMRDDVSLVVPGTTEYAGERHGREAVRRFVVALQPLIAPSGSPFEFSHVGEHMLVRLKARIDLAGVSRDTSFGFRIGFDEMEQITYMTVEPDDVELFDQVLLVAMAPGPDSWGPPGRMKWRSNACLRSADARPDPLTLVIERVVGGHPHNEVAVRPLFDGGHDGRPSDRLVGR